MKNVAGCHEFAAKAWMLARMIGFIGSGPESLVAILSSIQ